MLSYSYDIIMYIAINSPGHVNNVVDVINETDNFYLKEQMELINKLSSNCISNIDIIIKTGLMDSKVAKKMKRESIFKYQSQICTVKSISSVNHRSMKILWNNKLFPSL